MKRIIFALAVLLTFTCCSCSKAPADNGSTTTPPAEEETKGFEATGWNGYFVEAMAEAYDTFLEEDKMPVYINVEGIKYNKGKYIAAGCRILKKMIAEPDSWQDEEVDYITASCPDNEANNTLDIDEISLDDFLVVADKIYEYAGEKKYFPNYCTIDEAHKDADGSEYSTKMIINSISVAFARIFDYYIEHNALPESVSTWHSDFLRSVNNCPIDDPVVIAAMQTATEGATTDYDKAKAIFEYARDEWSYEGYNNTKYGAVKVINGKAGNCCDMSHAIIAMSRAAGIPARYRHAQCRYSTVIGHVMAEIYVDGVWYLCDATNDGNTFGNHESWSYMVTFNGRYNELPF